MKYNHNYQYIHEYSFPSSNFLRNNKEYLIEIYNNHLNNPQRVSSDFNLLNTPLNDHFSQKIKDLIEEYYIVEPSPFDVIFNLYIQNDKFSRNVFHNHAHSPMTICGVMYLDIPKEGGEIEFIHYPDFIGKRSIRIKPQEDKIYLFPNWLYHRPLPHTSSITRVCINFGYITNSRPMLKNYGLKW